VGIDLGGLDSVLLVAAAATAVGWLVAAAALYLVPATLIDLAARNVVDVEQQGPGVFYVRLRPASVGPLNSYEQRVLDHLRARAVNDVVPAEALTTGQFEPGG
jgi:hypothetical protein